MVHRTGGEGRTGLTVALLLTCLGVDRETVLDDYELTSRYRGAEHVPAVVELFVSAGIARAAAEGMLSTPRWAMAAALERLDDDHGGVEPYLRGPGRMAERSIERLRARLLA